MRDFGFARVFEGDGGAALCDISLEMAYSMRVGDEFVWPSRDLYIQQQGKFQRRAFTVEKLIFSGEGTSAVPARVVVIVSHLSDFVDGMPYDYN